MQFKPAFSQAIMASQLAAITWKRILKSCNEQLSESINSVVSYIKKNNTKNFQKRGREQDGKYYATM